ncbi:MAG: OsmC family protein [Bdellovibrionales bacterium]|nr:OsmC family protein [Bdellovibrionales bacterium]
MKAFLNWTGGMKFNAVAGDHTLVMDAKTPIGKDEGMTPKELVAVGLGGCTAMDVIALLKKHKQNHSSMKIEVDIATTQKGHPSVFENANITFDVEGDVDKNILLESIHLSQTKYCGVSAMISKACPIHYIVKLNGEVIGEGQAQF